MENHIDISDFEEESVEFRIGDSIFEELVVKKYKVPPCANLKDIILLRDMKAKRYIYDFSPKQIITG